MAEPVKISSPYVEEEERTEPAQEKLSGEQRARGFFRQHPYAKWVLLALALLLIAAGALIWHYYSVRESTDDAQIDGHIDPISARISGTVVEVLHDENQVVEKGTPLVELDREDYQVAADRGGCRSGPRRVGGDLDGAGADGEVCNRLG